MGSRNQSRVDELRKRLTSRGIGIVTEAEFDALLAPYAPVSRETLRKLLRETGIALSPVVEGVRQNDFEELERTLGNLTVEYERAAGDSGRRRTLRRLVITAKDHARFAARRTKDESRRRMKEEMAEWLLVWLENPAIFPQWVRLRRATRLM